jgi:hypothetical protein
MKTKFILTLLFLSVFTLLTATAKAGLVKIKPGDVIEANDGDVVQCEGASNESTKPQFYQCTLWYQGSPGKAHGMASPFICDAIISSINKCREQMGPHTAESVKKQFCVSNSMWYGMGARCVDQDGKAVQKPYCSGVEQ